MKGCVITLKLFYVTISNKFITDYQSQKMENHLFKVIDVKSFM